MPTLADVAHEAGCSLATASRALRDNPRISEATRRRVALAAAHVGYARRRQEVAPRSRKRPMIGLVVPSIRNSHYYGDASLLHDVLSREGYHIILCCHENDAERDAEILRSLVAVPVAGIIHTPCTVDGVEGVFGGVADVPIVELGTRSRSRQVDVVSTDEDGAVRELVEHLVSLGHRRIALFTGRREMFHIQVRARGFRAAAARSGLTAADCPVVYGPSSVPWFCEAMTTLLGRPNPPTAALVLNKPSAIGVLLALAELGLKVPDAVSVVGFTNEDWYAVTTPPLTTYEHPFPEMGMVAAELLLRRLAPVEERPFEPSVVRFSGNIALRTSTGPPPG